MLKKLRSFDQYGAPIKLTYDGEEDYNTIGGGIASLCQRTLLLAFFCLQLIAVFDYKDP